ncbi:hypothetical protein JCM10212_004498, partial [Sporobolomyces blumeae]
AELEHLRSVLPELPEHALTRLQREYGLSERDARVLVALGEGLEQGSSPSPERLEDDDDGANSKEGGEDDVGGGEMGADVGVRYFEQVARGRDPKTSANWVIHELIGQLTKHGFTLRTNPIDATELGALIDRVKLGALSGSTAKILLREFLSTRSTLPRPSRTTETFAEFVVRETARQGSPSPTTSTSSHSRSTSPSSSTTESSPNPTTHEDLLSNVLKASPTEVTKIRQQGPESKVVMRIVGEMMKRTKGRCDPNWVKGEVKRRLFP